MKFQIIKRHRGLELKVKCKIIYIIQEKHNNLIKRKT